MARKKAEPIFPEDPEMSMGTPEELTGAEYGQGKPPLFSPDGDTQFVPENSPDPPPETNGPGDFSESEAAVDQSGTEGTPAVSENESVTAETPDASENESDAEAAEGYGELLSELSENVPEGANREEAPPLMLPAAANDSTVPREEASPGDAPGTTDQMLMEEDGEAEPDNAPVPPPPAATVFSGLRRDDRILTIHARDEVESDAEREATLWHEIQNSFRTRRILTGSLDNVEQSESGRTLAVVNYNGFRVAIPAKEMMVNLPPTAEYEKLSYDERMALVTRRLYSRMGCELDFIVKGIENRSRSIVASRKDAMYRKRQTFYMDTDVSGRPLIYEGRIVQARVVAVAERLIRVEVFGVECNIRGGGLSRAWYGNANENFSVGDVILVRVLTVQRPDVENIRITADVRSVTREDSADLNKCVLQGHYVGRITDIRSGVNFIRLNNGVNAVAHSCYDFRTPGKKDDVSFVVTRIDPDHNVVVGIITRIIRQNL